MGFPKSAYKRFLKWTSKARKGFYNGWTPETLADDTRSLQLRDGGPRSASEWMADFLKTECYLETRSHQKSVVLVLFEAAAMASQFEHYLAPLRVSSAPFRGDASIPHKWNIAKRIEALHRIYPEKPVRVLYFGDLDPKGLSIPISALRDIWSWIHAPDLGATLNPGEIAAPDGERMWQVFATPNDRFEWIRVGINEGDSEVLEIEENPDKPGAYQWEALSDEQAGKMIREAVGRFWDSRVVSKTLKLEDTAEQLWRAEASKLIDRITRRSRKRVR